jgi:hypothetical protein
MKKLIATLLTSAWVSLAGIPSLGQECFGVKIKEGGGFEMANFDAKGKPNGLLKYLFKSVKQEGDVTVVEIQLESLSSKGKVETTQTFQMKCNGNESYVDAASLIMGEQLKSYESFNMVMKSNDIVFPNNLSVGQTLPDGSLTGTGDMSGIPVTLEMKITDRKVESKENIKVGAGEFDTFKVRAHTLMSTKTIANLKFEFESVSYRAPGVLWDIKTETYRKGKMIGSTELVKIY